MTRKMLAIGVIAATFIAFVVGYLIAKDGTAPTVMVTPSPSASPSTSALGPTLSPSPSYTHLDDESGEDYAPAVFSDNADAAALDVATKWINLHVNTELTRDEWLDGLRPLVTDWMMTFYYDEKDPNSTRTGKHFAVIGEIVDVSVRRGEIPEIAYAQIVTSKLDFEVQLLREHNDDPWRVATY